MLWNRTTTHRFADVDTCLGSDQSKWGWEFNGASANATAGTRGRVTLSTDGTAATQLPTPLKVSYPTDCSGTPPTMSIQLDAVVAGRLTVGGFDVAATLASLQAGPTPPVPPSPPPSPESPPPPAAPPETGSLVWEGKYCETNFWLNQYVSDPTDCVPFVRNEPSCVGSYFMHAGNSNGNCGCLASVVDCSDEANVHADSDMNVHLLLPAPPSSPPPSSPAMF